MLTYRELRDAAGAVGAQLENVHRVAVWADTTLDAMVALVGALEAGIEVVPLNPKLGSSELQHIISDARPEALLGPDHGRRVGQIPAVSVDVGAGARLRPPPNDPEQGALVVYTSGTTGLPKGVVLSRGALAANLDALADVWGWDSSDRLVHALPMFHVHGLILGLIGPLRRGGSVRHLGRFSPDRVADALAAGDTMLFGVPTMYHRLADAAEKNQHIADGLRRARLLVSGSAALPAKTFRRIEQVSGQRIVERYGMTETIMNTAVHADGDRRPGEVGPPLPGVDLRIVADEGCDVAWDDEAIGEVLVRGPNLFLGYLNQPDVTADVVRDGWFWTGDLATRSPDGYVRIVGRRSTDLIKTGGFKVGAGEVENVLLEHPAVAEAAVAGTPDDDLGERIAAWVVLVPGTEAPSSEELAEHVACLLAPHKRPRDVHLVAELPRNAMGKVVKQKLIASA